LKEIKESLLNTVVVSGVVFFLIGAVSIPGWLPD